MKNITTYFYVFLLTASVITLNAQSEDNPWLFSVGISGIDFYPTGGSESSSGDNAYYGEQFDEFFNVEDHWNVAIPYLSIGRYLKKDVSLVLTGTYNNIKKWGSIELDRELEFWSLDGSLNYSFANLLNTKKIDPHLGLGGGYTWIEEGPYNSNYTGSGNSLIGWGHLNATLGLSYWFNDHLGFTFQSTYNHVDNDGANKLPKHYRHTLGLSMRIGGTDSDGDGIYDKKDVCPNVPGLEIFNGCPDTDGDGVQDSDDRCPDTPGAIDYAGCPDSDGDGVSDDKDQCPNIAGLSALDGCPDADGDGIKDADDNCPGTSGPRGNRGCPWPDSDGDSVLDKDDQCPNETGTVANNGCPEDPTDEINEKLAGLSPITFSTGKASIKDDVSVTLLEVVTILNAYPKAQFVLEGHTDSVASEKFNQKLSDNRANAVLEFLTENGIDASRLSVSGFGEKAPVASNDSLEGKALNRRVEVKLVN